MFKPLDQWNHATVIIGNRAENFQQLKSFLENEGIVIQANPDFFVHEGEQLRMEEALEIIEQLTSQKVSRHRFVVISFDKIASDVQNRLLKTLEEPALGTFIILLLPSQDQLIQTITSRVRIIDGVIGGTDSRLNAADFLAMKAGERFSYVESFTKNKKDEDNVSKTEVENFIKNLEKELWDSGNKNVELHQQLMMCFEYTKRRGSSHRYILDYLAMICPS